MGAGSATLIVLAVALQTSGQLLPQNPGGSARGVALLMNEEADGQSRTPLQQPRTGCDAPATSFPAENMIWRPTTTVFVA